MELIKKANYGRIKFIKTVYGKSKGKDGKTVSGKDFWGDTNLTWKAKGLLAYLTQVNEKATINELINASKDQRTAVHTGLSELRKAGYLKRLPVRNEFGRYEAYTNEATGNKKIKRKEIEKES